MRIFSRHDSDIVPLLTFLNLTTPACLKKVFRNETVTENCGQAPDFAANILMELHDLGASEESDGNRYGIKIRYNGKYLKPCANSEICPYETFVSQVKSNLINFNTVCKVKQASESLSLIGDQKSKDHEEFFETLRKMM